jgi:hypothetical protein
LRKGKYSSKTKFTLLFKHLLALRSNDYKSEELKAISIIFAYHIYPIEYNFDDKDLLIDEIISISENKGHIEYKEDSDLKIKYMNPFSIFKLPLRFVGSHLFIKEFKEINRTTSDETIKDNYLIKYKIEIREITPSEIEVIISLQEDPSIVIYKFKDMLTSTLFLVKWCLNEYKYHMYYYVCNL